jgi:LCP family protein required for cell wall assembly
MISRAQILTVIIVIAILVLNTMPAQQAAPSQQPDDIPEPAALISYGDYDVLNILLIGADTTNPNNSGRTDVLLLISINRTAGTVAMLSLPRDLYVYIPGYRMQRINTAYGYGESNGIEGGGPRLLIETIRYNLGIPIDHYARVDFNGFRRIVDDLGGIEIAVDCAIQDWRLSEPDLDPTLEESWELFTLPVGLHRMDGDLALWYARSRRTSSDFDRGRRHQALMRALWQRIRAVGILDQITDVWPQVLEQVHTDIPLETLISLVPLALSIDSSRIASYTFRPNVEVRSWRSPEGSSVQVLNPDAVAALLARVAIPPTESQLVREGARIEIINATGIRGMDRVAADRLGWEGFVPIIGTPASSYQEYSRIYDYTGQTKGSSLAALMAILRVGEGGVIREPDPNRTIDFRVILGGSYYACTHSVQPPSQTEE